MLVSALIAACSLLVPSELEQVLCSQEGAIGPPACPLGERCTAGACAPCAGGICVPDAGSSGIGQLCQSAPCAPGLFCVDPATLGFSGPRFCTRSCCGSEACAETVNVCAPTAGGVNLCLPSVALGRSPGSSPRGAQCADPSDCRSGVCEDSKCADVCCRNAECASGQACVLRPIPGLGGGQGFMCGTSTGSGVVGSQGCVSGGECTNLMCITTPTVSYCSGPCCKKSDCQADLACVYDLARGLRGCKDMGTEAGPLAVGSPCQDGAECQSSLCQAFTGIGSLCTDSCCEDSDCGNPDALACRPVVSGQIAVLLCVPR